MSSRKKLVIGNWKMNFSVRQATSYAGKLAGKQIPVGVTVGIAPQALALSEISTILQKTGLKLAAQNGFYKDEGAFTGEVSMTMLRGISQYVLVGHSERRHILRESNDFIREKNAAAFRNGIIPVFCVGETLTERHNYHTNQVLSDQISLGLADLTAEEVSKTVIAYEPVWAIGTGEQAGPEDVQHAVEKIRTEVTQLYGEAAGSAVTILYGGSVTKDNAGSYLMTPGLDGLLVGGASLSVQTFWPIVEAAGESVPKKITVNKKER